jgi:hypothetical protein
MTPMPEQLDLFADQVGSGHAHAVKEPPAEPGPPILEPSAAVIARLSAAFREDHVDCLEELFP